jgi:hypothetical protein
MTQGSVCFLCVLAGVYAADHAAPSLPSFKSDVAVAPAAVADATISVDRVHFQGSNSRFALPVASDTSDVAAATQTTPSPASTESDIAMTM